MKTKIYSTVCVLIVGMLCFVFAIFIKSENKKDYEKTGEIFWGDCVIDDSLILERDLTKEYDINELYDLFGDRDINEDVLRKSKNISALKYNEVNEKFPVEIMRTTGYSVYKVRQGGYFYVCWIEGYEDSNFRKKAEPAVYFSAYLTSDKSIESFDSIIPGKSTAADVKKIDPSFELDFNGSSGIFSYSYLNSDSILHIEYEDKIGLNEYGDLVVKGIKILPREKEAAPSRFNTILEKDLPTSRNELIIRRVCIGVGVVAASAFVAAMVRRRKRSLVQNLNSKA